MQHFKVFFGADDPWGAKKPTDDQRRQAVSQANPQSPFSKVKGNGPALRMFQDIAFDALGRPDHACRDKVLVLLGNGNEEKVELVQAFSQVVKLPLVIIEPDACQTLDGIVEVIAVALDSEGVPLVEVVRPNYFVLPPCIIVVADSANLPEKVVNGLLPAMSEESSLLNTESGKSVHCHNGCWILADWDDSVSSRLSPARRFAVDVASVDPLRKWKESGEPLKWVEDHKGQWNHQDWLGLLAAMKNSQYWPMEPDSVGAVLEEIKREWWKQRQQARPAASSPSPPTSTPATARQDTKPQDAGLSFEERYRRAREEKFGKQAAARLDAMVGHGSASQQAGHGPVYCDCPDCGAAIDITGLPADRTIACPSCSFRFPCRIVRHYTASQERPTHRSSGRSSGDQVRPDALQATKASGQRVGHGPAYCDCPDCGAPIGITGLPADKTIACPSCSFSFACRDGLNQRSTLHAEEKRGWFGQILWGSSLQKSRKQKADQAISFLNNAIRGAILEGNYQKAQFYQMQLNQLLQSYEW